MDQTFFLPPPGAQAPACGPSMAMWLRFRAVCHSSAGAVTGSQSREPCGAGACPKQVSCGMASATFPFCSVSLGPFFQPGFPASLLILGASQHFLIKSLFNFSRKRVTADFYCLYSVTPTDTCHRGQGEAPVPNMGLGHMASRRACFGCCTSHPDPLP